MSCYNNIRGIVMQVAFESVWLLQIVTARFMQTSAWQLGPMARRGVAWRRGQPHNALQREHLLANYSSLRLTRIADSRRRSGPAGQPAAMLFLLEIQCTKCEFFENK